MPRDNQRTFWLLMTLYRHARGFLGWGNQTPPFALAFLPAKSTAMGGLPLAAKWQKLELPLDKIGATGAGGRRRVPSRGGKGLVGSDYADQRRR